jgi:mannose/fructose/N-acetylgalactosamine-specific phosphotransferase system component IIC
LIAAALLGAAAGVDRSAVGQTMLAHPLMAATLAGLLAGDPEGGARMGVSLGVLTLGRIPVGETRVRDNASAAVAAGFVGAHATQSEAGLILLLALMLAAPAGRLIDASRAWTLRRREALSPALAEGQSHGIASLHRIALLVEFVRGAGASVLLLLCCEAALRWLLPMADAAALEALAWSWRLAALVGLPAFVWLHRSAPAWRLGAIGTGAGAVAFWLSGGVSL